MTHCSIHSDNIRLLGRMDVTQDPVCLDWTGTGFEAEFQGSQLWTELEATEEEPGFWVLAAVDGMPVARFLVEYGRRWYPLVYGMDGTLRRRVTLMKETQCMPFAPRATVRLHGLKHDGTLLPLPEPKRRIEFIGDSLTSAEGALAPKDNTEWIGMWFTAFGNYSQYVCQTLDAERRIVSQSGQGVAWDFMGNREGNLSDRYHLTVGALRGEAAEARGCHKPYDFSAWPADFVLIRLLSNDVGGMRRMEKVDELRPELTDRCVSFLETVRMYNPSARIVWVLPGSQSLPEIGVEAVNRAKARGMERVSCLTLPDYGPEDHGARSHPNAAYNKRIGKITADYLLSLEGQQPSFR